MTRKILKGIDRNRWNNYNTISIYMLSIFLAVCERHQMNNILIETSSSQPIKYIEDRFCWLGFNV